MSVSWTFISDKSTSISTPIESRCEMFTCVAPICVELFHNKYPGPGSPVVEKVAEKRKRFED